MDFERIASEFEPKIRFLKVETLKRNWELAAQCNIKSITTLTLFRMGQSLPIKRHNGRMKRTVRRGLRMTSGTVPMRYKRTRSNSRSSFDKFAGRPDIADHRSGRELTGLPKPLLTTRSLKPHVWSLNHHRVSLPSSRTPAVPFLHAAI